MAFFDSTYSYSVIADCFVEVQDIDEAKALASKIGEQIDAEASLKNFEEGEDYACYRVEYNGELRVMADRYGEIDGIADDGDIEAEAIDNIKKAFAELGHNCFETELIDADVPSVKSIQEDVQNDISDYEDRRRTHCLSYDG